MTSLAEATKTQMATNGAPQTANSNGKNKAKHSPPLPLVATTRGQGRTLKQEPQGYNQCILFRGCFEPNLHIVFIFLIIFSKAS